MARLCIHSIVCMSLGEDLVSEDLSQRGAATSYSSSITQLLVVDFKVVSANGSTAPLEREARKAIEQIGGGYLKSVFVSSRLKRASKVILVGLGVVAVTAKEKKGFAMIASS
jgi:hypothetical protein